MAVNSNTGVVLPNAGAGTSRSPISGFIALIWKNRLSRPVKLRHELVFHLQFFVQMAEADEVTKLEQKFVGGFFLRRDFLSGSLSG